MTTAYFTSGLKVESAIRLLIPGRKLGQWCKKELTLLYGLWQGTNARKVISEVYAFCVLQCTVTGRKSKHKTDITAWHGINFHKKNSMKYFGHRKLLCEFSKLSKLNAFNLLGYQTNTDASILVYKFRQ